MASPTNMKGIELALAKPGFVAQGITADFLAQNRDAPAVIAILFVGSLVTITVALRCYARRFIVKSFGLDDWLTVITMIPYFAFIALCIILIHLGSGRHYYYIQYVLDNDTVNRTEVLDFAAHIVYTTTLAICRLSGLAFYRRISNGHRKLVRTTHIAGVFILLAYLPQVFLIIFHCLPVTGYWPYGWQVPEVNRYSCIQWGAVYVTNSCLSLVCDMILFTIPIAIINTLQAKLSQKIKLAFVLLPGVLVIAISCTRIYLVVVGQWDLDESWSYDPFLAIEVSEIGATLISLSVPALKPFFGNLIARTGLSIRSRTTKVAGSKPTPRTSTPVMKIHDDLKADSVMDTHELEEYEPAGSESSTLGIVAEHKTQHDV